METRIKYFPPLSVASARAAEQFNRFNDVFIEMEKNEFWQVDTPERAMMNMKIMSTQPYQRNLLAPPQKPYWRQQVHNQMIIRVGSSHMSAAMVREMNADPTYRRYMRNKKTNNEEGD